MKYPYIQEKKKIESGICEVCKETKPVNRIEWRVNIFQGDCEFEDICTKCLNEKNKKIEQEKKEYYKKMEPIWEKRRKEIEDRELKLRSMLEENNISIKEYDNGQLCLGGIIDWWTTTGTAIHRKTRQHFKFSIKNPEYIIKIIKN